MTLLYRIGTALYHLGLRLAARAGHARARRWTNGRRVAPDLPAGSADRPLLWMHCASLGEWEQGRPVLAALRAAYPAATTVLTFFSPSGYERADAAGVADHVAYLPADGPARAEAWVRDLRPTLAIFVKYEFWFFHLRALHRAGVPTFLVAASFRPEQRFFRPGGGWWRRMLGFFSGIVTQTADDRELLTGPGAYPAARSAVGGDPRMDRTRELAAAPFTDPLIAAFTAPARLTIVAGSVWPADLRALRTAWPALPPDVRLILAPHQLHAAELARTQVRWEAVRYTSADTPTVAASRVLLLDTIGMLSRVYRYGDIAYVGGGFQTGLHNTLEPLAYGLPTLFGPRHRKFPEAAAAIRAGGARSVSNGAELRSALTDLLDDDRRAAAAGAQRQLADRHAGAGERTAAQVRNWLTAPLLALLLLLLPGTRVRAQTDAAAPPPDTERLATAVENAFEKGNLLVALSGVEWRTGLALAGAVVPTGAVIELNLSLEGNATYAIVASAESEGYDLDLYLRAPSGLLITRDNAADGTPILEFTAPSTGSYQLQVHAARGATPRTFLAVSLLRGGGGLLLEEDFRTISRTFFAATAALLRRRPRAGWVSGDAQWCLFGLNLEDENGTTLRRLRPGAGNHAFLVTGHPNIRDIDLYLADHEQRIVAWETATGNNPLLYHESGAGDTYDLRVEIGKGRLPRLMLLGILAF